MNIVWAVLVSLALTASGGKTPAPAAPGRGLVPEAERSLRRVILGAEPNRTTLFMVPETQAWDPKTGDPHVRWLRRQLYRIHFELEHGQIFRHSPPYSRFFVAVPDPSTTPDALGNEEAILREHLRERAGWSDAVIAERVRFFTVPSPVTFPQDMAEPLGYDERDRLVLGVGDDVEDHYRRAVERLAETYPDDFVVRPLPGINTEGGDLALVRLPDGGVGLLVGHNRIRRWVEPRHKDLAPGAPISEARIEEGRLAYQKAFDGVETIVVGREALADPSLANPEIFHLDMVVAVLRGSSGVVAYVPTLKTNPVDAITHVHLDPEAARRFQAEYDRAALQLAARGYHVTRVPFSDHPARNPVGIGKFVDPATGQASILLGRYPEHLEGSDERNAQTQLQIAFESLDAAVAAWRREPTDPRWLAVKASVEAIWRQMDAAVAAPNPEFETQKRVYASNGIRVLPLPIFPTGEGGVHCLVLK